MRREMEFDEHEEEEEEQEEEIEMHQTAEGKANEGILSAAAVTVAATREGGGDGGVRYRYKECLKNHAVGIAGHAVDGCGEFMAAGEEGTLDALMCAACNCHRNFHRKVFDQPGHHHHHSHQLLHRTLTFHHDHHHQFSNLHATSSSHPARPDLALPSSTSREDEDMSNPSSSGGGGGGGSGGGSGSKKRFRTKFTQEQKDKMFTFAEKLGWRIQRQDEADVQQFCAEHSVRRHVFKVWMHNNKHTLGKKP